MALKKPQRSLKSWGRQKWKTSDGSPSKGKKRYLPAAAWKSLSKSEKAATNKATTNVKIPTNITSILFITYNMINKSLFQPILQKCFDIYLKLWLNLKVV